MVPGFKQREIKPTKTVGQRLRDARKKKEMTLEQAEQLTNVKLKYLRALEEDRHEALPSEVYTLGFLRCFAESLGLNPKKLIDQYRREYSTVQSAKGNLEPTLAPTTRLIRPKILITPKLLLTVASVSVVVGLVAYVGVGIQSFLAPPPLTIAQPKADSKVSENHLLITGETDSTASLTINGEMVSVSPDGKFKQDITVLPGLNTLEFVAINRVGKEAKLTRKVLAEYQVIPSPVAGVSPSPSPSVVPIGSAVTNEVKN